MILDEFLIALGVKADTKALEETERGLERVEDQAEKTDKKLSGFSTKLSGFIKNFATYALAAVGAIKTIMVGAWAYLDSTIDRVEELQNAEDESIRTTKEQVEMAKKYRENMDKMGKTIENVKTRIALAFLPTMYKLSESYAKFLDSNKELIAKGISVLLQWVTRAAQVFTNFIRFIEKIVVNTVGWKNALLILVAVLGIVKRATIAAFIVNPITWVMAAIAGLLLLIDDFMTYLDGGESQFGEYWGAMLKWVNDNKDALNALKDVFMNVMNFIAGVVAMIVGIFTGDTALMSVAWEGMIESFKNAWNGLAMFFEPAAQAFYTIVNNVVDKIVGAFKRMVSVAISILSSWVSTLSTIFTGVFNAITEPFRKAFDWVADKWQGLKGLFGAGVGVNVNAGIGSAVSNTSNRVISNNTVVNNNGSFNINGATSPKATANAVSQNWNAIASRNIGGTAKA